MTIKEEVSNYLQTVMDRLEDIANEDLRAVASLGVAQVLEEIVYELKYSKNLYKENFNGSN